MSCALLQQPLSRTDKSFFELFRLSHHINMPRPLMKSLLVDTFNIKCFQIQLNVQLYTKTFIAYAHKKLKVWSRKSIHSFIPLSHSYSQIIHRPSINPFIYPVLPSGDSGFVRHLLPLSVWNIQLQCGDQMTCAVAYCSPCLPLTCMNAFTRKFMCLVTQTQVFARELLRAPFSPVVIPRCARNTRLHFSRLHRLRRLAYRILKTF